MAAGADEGRRARSASLAGRSDDGQRSPGPRLDRSSSSSSTFLAINSSSERRLRRALAFRHLPGPDISAAALEAESPRVSTSPAPLSARLPRPVDSEEYLPVAEGAALDAEGVPTLEVKDAESPAAPEIQVSPNSVSATTATSMEGLSSCWGLGTPSSRPRVVRERPRQTPPPPSPPAVGSTSLPLHEMYEVLLAQEQQICNNKARVSALQQMLLQQLEERKKTKFLNAEIAKLSAKHQEMLALSEDQKVQLHKAKLHRQALYQEVRRLRGPGRRRASSAPNGKAVKASMEVLPCKRDDRGIAQKGRSAIPARRNSSPPTSPDSGPGPQRSSSAAALRGPKQSKMEGTEGQPAADSPRSLRRGRSTSATALHRSKPFLLPPGAKAPAQACQGFPGRSETQRRQSDGDLVRNRWRRGEVAHLQLQELHESTQVEEQHSGRSSSTAGMSRSKSSAKTSSARPCPGDVEHQLQELEHQLQCIAQAEEREKGRSSPRSPAAAMERSRPRAKTATGQVPQGTLARAETRRRRSEGDAQTLRPEAVREPDNGQTGQKTGAGPLPHREEEQPSKPQLPLSARSTALRPGELPSSSPTKGKELLAASSPDGTLTSPHSQEELLHASSSFFRLGSEVPLVASPVSPGASEQSLSLRARQLVKGEEVGVERVCLASSPSASPSDHADSCEKLWTSPGTSELEQARTLGKMSARQLVGEEEAAVERVRLESSPSASPSDNVDMQQALRAPERPVAQEPVTRQAEVSPWITGCPEPTLLTRCRALAASKAMCEAAAERASKTQASLMQLQYREEAVMVELWQEKKDREQRQQTRLRLSPAAGGEPGTVRPIF